MIVVGIETTGPDPKRNSIISIGSLDTEKLLSDEKEPLFYGECRIRQGAEIEPLALKISSFTEHQIKYQNPESHDELIRRWVFWIKSSKDKTLAGENIGYFGLPFIKYALYSSGYDLDFINKTIGTRSIDIHSLSYAHHQATNTPIPSKYERSALSLDETLVYLNLPKKPSPHNALIEAILKAEAYYRLVFSDSLFSKVSLKNIIPKEFPNKRRKDIPNFNNHPIPQFSNK
ncbi:MAG: hypothetical protein N3D20_01500 [Candidatus Pacearchaeota archaeon]|nr:hypothetical protein [Candidatus Pacearchaeota archaeon]